MVDGVEAREAGDGGCYGGGIVLEGADVVCDGFRVIVVEVGFVADLDGLEVGDRDGLNAGLRELYAGVDGGEFEGDVEDPFDSGEGGEGVEPFWAEGDADGDIEKLLAGGVDDCFGLRGDVFGVVPERESGEARGGKEVKGWEVGKRKESQGTKDRMWIDCS